MYGKRGWIMLKKDFIKLYSEINGIEDRDIVSKDVEEFLNTMKEAFKKYPKITFRNFGVFEVKATAERKIADPRGNNNIINSKSRKYIKFRVSRNIEKFLYEKK